MTRRAFFIAMLFALIGCAAFDALQPQLGEKVVPPIGYILHCMDYPESVFCVPD
jgi:hypothetical protein